VLYLSGCKNPNMLDALDAGLVGLLNQPASSYTIRPGWVWAADNGCFNRSTYVGDDAWYEWILSRENKEWCLFASAPDVIGDWHETLAVSVPWLPRIRSAGYRAALVLQDGAEPGEVPWDELDAVFVGGSTEWKLRGTAHLIGAALARGKHVHVGRVNSWKRYEHFALQGADSADGTIMAFGPDIHLSSVLRWRKRFESQPALF
jgi:hypothetical protein